MAIAKLECTCRRCGASFTVRREFRNRREANDWEAWAKSYGNYDLCTDCYKQEQAEAAAEANKADDMPKLAGTPKQVAWAEKIRAEQLKRFHRYTAEGFSQCDGKTPEEKAKFKAGVARYMAAFRSVTSAAEWIDHRMDTLLWIREKLSKEVAK